MSEDRITQMRQLVSQFPDEPRGRYFLAHELFRREQWEEALTHYDAYLRLTPSDEGAGWKNYGIALARVGRSDDARRAFERGIEQARTHHHEGLAAEIQELLEEIG
jgi:Flp pilus assembly protein TadD